LEIKNKNWNKLNLIKKNGNREAFFYWYQALTLLNLIEEPKQA
jgi:hypothetical protein